MKAPKTHLSGVIVLAAIGAVACKPQPPEGASRGAALYETCASCHGEQGEGKQDYWAPAIAGMPQWYVEAQLTKFKAGIRAGDPDDMEGLRMRPMSYSLEHEGDIPAVAEYVANLPATNPVATLDGDPERGKALYGTCAACHGQDGKGNQALNSPDLTLTNDWYLLTQLKKFKGGIRGANPKDVTGQQMAPMANTLTDEKAMKHVVAYIESLSK